MSYKNITNRSKNRCKEKHADNTIYTHVQPHNQVNSIICFFLCLITTPIEGIQYIVTRVNKFFYFISEFDFIVNIFYFRRQEVIQFRALEKYEFLQMSTAKKRYSYMKVISIGPISSFTPKPNFMHIH